MSVDEAMILFKCRSALKQYMPKKLARRGIKVWALANNSSGYIANLQVYTGKQGDKETLEKRLGAKKAVKRLIAPYMNSFRNVYFDIFHGHQSSPRASKVPSLCMWNGEDQPEGLSLCAETCGEEGYEGQG